MAIVKSLSRTQSTALGGNIRHFRLADSFPNRCSITYTRYPSTRSLRNILVHSNVNGPIDPAATAAPTNNNIYYSIRRATTNIKYIFAILVANCVPSCVT